MRAPCLPFADLPGMKSLVLLLFILCAASGSAGAAEANYRYQAKPIGWQAAGGDLEVVFIVCKDGDALTTMKIQSSGSSRWRSTLAPLMEKGDLEYSYFEVTIDRELAATTTKSLTGFDIVAKDTVRDMASYRNRIGVPERENPSLISDSQIRSLKVITQNEYLNVKPRIVEVPAGAR